MFSPVILSDGCTQLQTQVARLGCAIVEKETPYISQLKKASKSLWSQKI